MFTNTIKQATKFTTILFLLFLWSLTEVQAQRVGSAARGGSLRIEKVETDKTQTVQFKINGIKALPSPSPTPTSDSSKEECNPETVNGTCPGTFSFSYGFNANASPREGGKSSMRAGFAFATYLTKRVFLELDNDNVLSVKSPTGDRVTGLGDTSVYLGADVLLGIKPKEPVLTILYGVKAPSASTRKGLGTGQVDHTLLLALGKAVGKTTYVELDIGNTFAGRENSRGYDSFPFASGFIRQKLDKNKRFTLHVEFGGNFKASGYEGDAYNLTYLESQITPHVALRTGARFGITDNVSRAGLFLGIKFNGNLKKLFR